MHSFQIKLPHNRKTIHTRFISESTELICIKFGISGLQQGLSGEFSFGSCQSSVTPISHGLQI